MKNFYTGIIGLTASASLLSAATVNLSSGTYTENFNAIATTAANGWDVRTAATASTLGTVGSYTATATSWGTGTGEFRNVAAVAALASNASSTVQAAASDRAMGIRQTGTFGDPGASFNFNFSTSALTISSITIDLQMLSVQDRSTTWSIQYGIGASPSSFTTLANYSDPGVFGSTTQSFTTADFGTNLDNQAQLWFRIVALSAATGPNNRDTFAIDNFSITAVPETSTSLLGLLGTLCLLRRRRM